MKTVKRLLSIAAVAAFGVQLGCASAWTLDPNQNKVSKDGVVSVWADRIKDKGSKFDIRLSVSNDSEKSTIINLSEMECFQGSMRGELKHTFFNTGERTIDFKPKEVKKFSMVCKMGANSTGPFKIRIRRVLDNPSNDGKTPGAVLSRDIEWKIMTPAG